MTTINDYKKQIEKGCGNNRQGNYGSEINGRVCNEIILCKGCRAKLQAIEEYQKIIEENYEKATYKTSIKELKNSIIGGLAN